MKKTLIALAVMFSFSAFLKAGTVPPAPQVPETVTTAETQTFTDLDFAKSISGVTIALETPKEEVQDKKEEIKFEKLGKYITLQGYVTLQGGLWVPQNGGYATTYLNSWVQLRDYTGKYQTNNEYVNVHAGFWVKPDQYVWQTVYPRIYVTVYRDGKMVGSTYTDGSISVSGWASGSYMRLSGSGYMSASLYVQEEETPVKK